MTPPRAPRASRGRRARIESQYALAKVTLWGRPVGVIAEDADHRITFEYDDAFRSSGLEMSPFHLPLARRGPIEFPALQRVEAFHGLPGVFADSLPDAFGNAVIRRYFASRGTPDAALSPVQKLLYIGDRAMGALQFAPALERSTSRGGAAEEAIEIATLVMQARAALTGALAGTAEETIPEMLRIGASAGGARAKAVVRWNPATQRIASPWASEAPGDEDWLIKFDGVTGGGGGHTTAAVAEPGPWGRIEYVYSQLARAAGITMMPTTLVEEHGRAHFMTQRFDRVAGQRMHVHTYGGLDHADFNVRQVRSYEDHLRAARRLGLGQGAVNEAFRRMAFNIVARNQDDHVKNLAFMMRPDGAWDLAPAYDVVFAHGGQWMRTHQMRAADKDDAFTRADVLAVGAQFDVPRDGAHILDAVLDSMTTWEVRAREVALDPEITRHIGSLVRWLR